MVDIIPRLAADGHAVELTMIGTVSEFVGYEDPATVTNKAGKPMPKNWAIPHFRNRQFTATVSVENAQTLVLGSGPVPITTTSHTKDKVPLLEVTFRCWAVCSGQTKPPPTPSRKT